MRPSGGSCSGIAFVERAAGHRRVALGHAQAQVGRRVIGDFALRVPSRSPGVDVARQRLDREEFVLRHAERFALGRNRRQPSAVGELQIHQLVGLQRLRQVDDDVVLAAHPQAHQVTMPPAGDRSHGERLGKVQDKGRGRAVARGQEQRGPAFNPFPAWIEAGVDVVVDDVEVGRVVFVEERPARGQLFLRRVNGDGPGARTIEEPDVFRIAHRFHVGEVPAVGVHLGNEIAELRNHRPPVAAQVRELDAERSGQVFLEDRLRAPKVARVHVAGMERRDVEPSIEFGGMRAQIHPVEARVQRFVPAVNLHLAPFGCRCRGKRHLASSENDDAGDTGVGFRDEGGAVRHAQLEVLGAHRQVDHRVLLFRAQRQAIEAAHGGQHRETRNLPLVSRGRNPLDPDHPRADAAIPAKLGQGIDIHVVVLAFWQRLRLGPQPLLHDGAGYTCLNPFFEKFLAGRGLGKEEGRIHLRIARHEHALELAQHPADAVVGRRRGLGLAALRAHQQGQQREDKDAPHVSIRPRQKAFDSRLCP